MVYKVVFPTKYIIKVSETNVHIRFSFCIYEHGFLEDSGSARSRRLGVCGSKIGGKGKKVRILLESVSCSKSPLFVFICLCLVYWIML